MWEDLEKSIQDCQKCKLCQTRKNIVFGEGNRDADIMFIGEGPGADEDAQGRPFVGKAGQLMNKAFLLKLPVITKTFLCKLQAVFNLNLNKQ